MWAASQLRTGDRGKGKRREGGSRAKRERKIRMAQVVQRPSKAPVVESVAIEIGGAMITVRRGFDQSLLQDVVIALRGAR